MITFVYYTLPHCGDWRRRRVGDAHCPHRTGPATPQPHPESPHIEFIDVSNGGIGSASEWSRERDDIRIHSPHSQHRVVRGKHCPLRRHVLLTRTRSCEGARWERDTPPRPSAAARTRTPYGRVDRPPGPGRAAGRGERRAQAAGGGGEYARCIAVAITSLQGFTSAFALAVVEAFVLWMSGASATIDWGIWKRAVRNQAGGIELATGNFLFSAPLHSFSYAAVLFFPVELRVG